MPSNKKAEIVITCNSAQPKAAVRAMKVELDKLTKSYEQLNNAGKAGTAKAKNMLQDIKDLRAAIKNTEADMTKVSKVTQNLADSSLRQLKLALAQVKKEMSSTSENSKRLDSLRQKYKAINDQIKVLEGTYVNIGKHINDLSSRTDSWLSKAISQQKTHIASIDKQNHEYQVQMGILKKLEAEEAKRTAAKSMNTINANYATAVQTMTAGGASAAQLRDARSALLAKRDTISPTTEAKKKEIEQINALLKQTELELDKIAGKEKEAIPTTKEVAKSVNALTKNLNAATPEQLRKGLEACRAQLDKMGTGDPRRKAWVQWAKQLETALSNVDKRAIDINKVMANLKTTPLEKLKQAAKQLEQEIATMTRRTGEFTSKQKQLAALRAEINKTTGAVQQQSSAWGTTLKNMTAYFGAFQMFSIAIRKVTKVFKDNFAFSDQLADIRKVSGLAMKSIDELAVRLAKLDTRTTIQELNQIAYAGAKLGMAKYGIEGLEGFTRAANQVNVALKEDLGADALTALSKITEVMGLIPKMGVEQSMLATGSAMFQLAATSTATAGNIVEFSKRLTGMARTAGITTDQLLGLGSAADSMFLMPEVASTAFNKFITSLQTKHNLIEKELSIEPGTINRLYSAGKIVDAMVLVFEQMREKGNMNALQSVFKDLGSEGARLVNVMVTMSKNVDMLKEHLATSEEAFQEATAVSKEYAIQQETANALMERAGNIWEKAFVNPDGVDSVKQLAKAWYDLSQTMTNNVVTMGVMKGVLALIIGELKILLYMLPAILAGLMFKGVAAAITGVASSIGLMGQNAVIATLRTNGLVAAWKALNVAQKANVIGVVITLLTSLAMVIADVIGKTQKATQWMEGFNTTMSDFNRESAIANARLDRFRKAIDEAGEGTRQRHAAIRNFNKEYGQYLSKMLTEKSTAEDVANAYKEVVKQMRAKIALQMKEKDIEKQVAPRIGWQADRLTEYDQQAGGTAYNGTWLKAYVDDMREAGKSVEEINRELAKKLGVNSTIAQDAYNKRSQKSPTTYFDAKTAQSQIGFGMEPDAGAVRNNTRQLTQQEKMLYAATRYAAQVYSTANALDKVNKKWEPFQEDIVKAVDESPGTLDNEAPDKEEAARRKREEAERRKALRAEMKEEQGKAKAIIDNVKNYYERQITAITEMATEGGMDPQLQKKLVDGMTIRMNSALANVRQAIAGTENEWQQFRETMIQDLYEPLGDDGTNQSTQLLDDIIHNDIDKLKEMITTLSKELGQNGSVLLDQIWRKATENELQNAKKENQAYQERQKLLLEKNYTGKVNKDYEGQMEQLGLAELTSGQTQNLMQFSKDGNKAGIQTAVAERSKMWQEAFLNAREHIVDVFATDVSTEEGQKAMLTLLFGPDYEKSVGGSWLAGILNMDLQQWQVFYQKLIEMSDAYTDAQKKAYDEAKRRADFVFNNRSDVQQIDQTTTTLSDESSYVQRFETDKSVAQQMGLTWNMESDPEVMRYRLLAERAKLYYEEMDRLRQQDKISEQQLTEAKRQMMDAQNAMADKVAAKFQERIGLLQSFSEPLATFAEGVGEKLGNMIAETEDSNIKLRDLAKDMLKAYAKMTIQMIAEDLTRRVKRQLYYRQEEADETQHQATMLQIQQAFATIMQTVQATSDATRLAQHQTANATELSEEAAATTGKVSLGIAGGAAKIIGTLGFWGIPLIAVISALLMGLLSWAISAALGGSDSGAEASGQNVKLATGMLTYDSGNVQSFGGGQNGGQQGQTQTVVGNDGNVYQTQHVDKLSTGLVTKPISTMVNGQPAVVGEKGPEMVIGRETTQAMMMNRPDLMNEIVKFDKNRSGMHYRMYDEGNLADFAEGMAGTDAAAAPSLSQEDVQQLRGAITEFTAMMLLLQKNGLHVNKYGRGGIAEEAEDGAQFMGRYSGSRLWNKKK